MRKSIKDRIALFNSSSTNNNNVRNSDKTNKPEKKKQ